MTSPQGSEPRPPRTWLMLGHKAGDNSQITAMAEAAGWTVSRLDVSPEPSVALSLLRG